MRYDTIAALMRYDIAATTITLQMRYDTIAALHSHTDEHDNNHHITDEI